MQGAVPHEFELKEQKASDSEMNWMQLNISVHHAAVVLFQFMLFTEVSWSESSSSVTIEATAWCEVQDFNWLKRQARRGKTCVNRVHSPPKPSVRLASDSLLTKNFHGRLCPEKQTCKRFNSTGLLQGTWTFFITFCQVRCELGCLSALVPVSEMLPGFPQLAVGSHHQAAPECGDEKRRRGALVWTWPRAVGRCYQKERKRQKNKMQKNVKMTSEKKTFDMLLMLQWSEVF